MRPHGRYEVDATRPRARGVCDRCGAIYNHDQLRFQYDWRGPRLQNLRILVCESCQDLFQQNGQRTILIPPDPVPIQNVRPEYYVGDDNPLSAIGVGANWFNQTEGNRIGNMTQNGNINAAFDGNPYKPFFLCATISVSNSSFNNYVGINWTGNQTVLNAPSSLQSPVITHTVTSFTINAPMGGTFGSTAYAIQGSVTGSPAWGAWNTIASGNTAGAIGEAISGATTGGKYGFHRAAFYGTGAAISVAQVTFNVGETR
jgi:hypothetical protein